MMRTESPTACPTCCNGIISSAKSRHNTMRYFKHQFSAPSISLPPSFLSFTISIVYLSNLSSSIHSHTHRTCMRPFGCPFQPLNSLVLSTFGFKFLSLVICCNSVRQYWQWLLNILSRASSSDLTSAMVLFCICRMPQGRDAVITVMFLSCGDIQNVPSSSEANTKDSMSLTLRFVHNAAFRGTHQASSFFKTHKLLAVPPIASIHIE